MRDDLPRGTVTFLFTDVEGSTKLLHELGAEGYADALAEHRRLIREACAAHGGVEVDTQGDAFFFAFPTAPGALAAAEAMIRELAPGPIQVRVGLHTGTPLVTGEGYVGGDVHRAARIAAVGHGGQVLVSASTAQLTEMELVDLGDHRLKDLSAPERIFQLRGGEFPPLKSLYRTNLPVPATPFLGRERELAEVVGLLEGTRLLTLTGPGGMGKTRLAAQAAGMSADAYPDGVWWVPLETLRDPTLVLESIANALGARQELGAHVGGQRMLVILDCFEHVVAAAADIADLLRRCPNLELLVTSRERLDLAGEQEYPVPSFAHEEAVGFFSARARTVSPDFVADDAVAEICRRLDDMPLALELAAAQTKVLSPRQTLERGLGLSTPGPRDLPDRQRTLRATIEWSHELLTEEEQRVFRRLSVFASGCTLDGAEEVAGADVHTLQALVNKSLIRVADERFRMLDTIREYASMRLDEAGEADHIYERLARHLIAVATALGGPLFVERQADAFARFELEHGNARAVVDWGLGRGRHDLVAELASLLGGAWSARGHARESRGWDEAILESRPEVSSEIWARFLIQAVDTTKETGEWHRAIELAEELVESMSEDDSVDPLYVAAALADLSDAALGQGDLRGARQYAERSLAFRAAHGVPAARALGSLAELALEEDDLVQARLHYAGAAADYERVGHEVNYIYMLEGLGEVARRGGELDRAAELFADGMRRSVQLGDQSGAGDFLEAMALVEHDRGHIEAAARLWGAGEALLAVTAAAPRRRRVVPDLPADAMVEGAAMTLDEAVEYALGHADA